MKKIFRNKKFLFALLAVSSIGFVAGIPLSDDKTILEQIIAAFPSGEADKPKQQEAKKSLDDVWAEVEKLAANNGEDSLTLAGKIRLYDNADEDGIREQQNFLLQQAGDDQWFRLDSFERVQLGHNLLLIDHLEKEIVSQNSGQADSLFTAYKMMDPQKLKEILIKDGTTAEINQQEGYKVLNIKPGTMDAVNEYNIFYDPSSYEIKKIRMSYTSNPYQDYLENYKDPSPQKQEALQEPKVERNTSDTVNVDDIEMNITEYVIEFEITRKEKRCAVNFLDNDHYTINNSSEAIFKGKWANYKKVEY